jgi:hypothetical protein
VKQWSLARRAVWRIRCWAVYGTLGVGRYLVRVAEGHFGRAYAFGYPPALVKACEDPFDYALKLRTGELWYFNEATPINREWVSINTVEAFGHSDEASRLETKRPPFDRGVDVRVSDIVWVADAPHGS